MYKKTFLRPILIVGLITVIFASCDKDFNEIGTDIVGDDHFGFDLDSLSTVKAYNQKLGPIASNDLPINPLGFYTNPAFGTTQANFVTQVELSSTSPVFNNTNSELFVELPEIDSVIMDVPYFKTLKTENADDTNTYELDSIYGQAVASANSKFKLSVYESGYYLRDLDPTQSLTEEQLFYTDQNGLIDGNKIPVRLNNHADEDENDQFYFDPREHKLTTYESDGITPIYTRVAPSMRLHLRTDVFYDKILNAPSGQLATNDVFKNYFRGIYFKVEHGSNPGQGNMAMLNFKAGKITIYYQEDKITEDNPATTTIDEYKVERPKKTFALNFTGNTVSLLDNSNENTNYQTAANSSQEAPRLYLKGGEGAMAVIDLFGSTDLKGYTLNPAFNESLTISSTNPKYIVNNTPNGISDEIDNIKVNGWLINEANLTFYVDKPAMSHLTSTAPEDQPAEPNRIFLYDLTNKKVLVDYTFDFTTNSRFPKYGKYIHDGIVQTENVSDGRGKRAKKYRVRITNHVRNLVKNDSTNVRLGLSVTEDINNISFAKLRTPNSNVSSAPKMSVLSPLGTILYGTNISDAIPQTQEYKKRLKLEIYYTKPN
ncbi:MAG: DUF4270 domain-containing protein [Bacteroidota bacterium]